MLVSMNDIIEDLYKGMIKFSPDINLEGLKIDIDVDDDIIQRIDRILTRSAELMHGTFPALDGSDRCTETYRDLVKNMWNCITCGAQFGIKQVECPLCKVFRPLETYDNLLHRPEKVIPDEIDALKQRRKIEKQIILDLELNGENQKKGGASTKNAAANVKSHWYMIGSEWLFKWKCFVTNKISKAVS